MANIIQVGTATQIDDQNLSFNIDVQSNLCVAIFVASSTSQDTAEPGEFTDSLGNLWQPLQWSAETSTQPAIAVFVTIGVNGGSLATGVTTLTIPAEMIPGDSLSTAVLGWLFTSKLGIIATDGFSIEPMTVRMIDDAVIGSVIVTQTGNDDLVIGITWSSLATGAFSAGNFSGGSTFGGTEQLGTATNNLAANGFLMAASWAEVISGPTTYATDFFVDPTADSPNYSVVAAVSLALSGIIVGGSGNSTRSFFLSRAPEPKQSVPSRFIATIQIDVTQMKFNSFANTPCQLPEFSMPPNGSFGAIGYGWSVLEFDLEHVGNAGSGLDQVRKLIAHSRPSFGYTEDSLSAQDGSINPGGACYALLTNTTTLQTECLGGGAIMAAQTSETNDTNASFFYEKLHCAFPGHKGGMKYRFLAFSNQPTGSGLYTLNFLNYDDGQGSLQYVGCLAGRGD